MWSGPNSLPQISPEPPPAAPAHEPPWNLWDVLLLALFALAAISIAGAVVVGLTESLRGLRPPSKELLRSAKIVVPAQALAYFALLWFMGRLVARRTPQPFWRAVHWRWPAPARLASYLIGGFVLSLLVNLLSGFLPMPRQLPIEEFFRDSTSAYLMALFGSLLAPLVEELFFRGFLYPALERPLGQAPAIVLTAAAFAFIHQQQLAHALAPLLVLFLVGMVLTLVRAYADSVAASMLVHIAYNGAIFAALFASTHGFRHMPIG